jgi:hypothetical protein
MKLAKIAVASSNVGKKVVGGLVLAASSGVALAQTTVVTTGPDLSSLTRSISMDTVITGVLAVAATMVGLYLAIKGAKTILGMIKSA